MNPDSQPYAKPDPELVKELLKKWTEERLQQLKSQPRSYEEALKKKKK